jgi:phospholipase C
MNWRRFAAIASVAIIAAVLGGSSAQSAPPGEDTGAVTPIQHLVAIFQENVSFDHYFATYPHAANPPG